MRIVRLMTDDGQILLGDDRQDGTAIVLIDGQGVLGPREEEKAAREMLRGRQALVADDDEGIRRVVTRTLERFVGPDYKVLASYGHVRDLPAKDGSVRPDEGFAMDWEL